MGLKVIAAACLIFFLASTLPFASSVKAELSGTFHFRAYIDGSDYVYIQNAGGKVWYEHVLYDYPGEHEPYSVDSPAATTLDGVNWIPTWDKTTKKSNTYISSSPQNYPNGAWLALSINKITNSSDPTQTRGPLTVEEWPSNSNSYTAKILLNDDTGAIVFQGAAWYEFELSWEAGESDVGLAWEIIAAVIVVVAAVIIFMAFFLRSRSRTKP